MRLDLRARHALLLQGPVGPFFRRFADELRERGIRVTKVNFNAGDALFFHGRGPDVVSYSGRLEAWPEALRVLVQERGIDAIFLFGDLRPIHRPAVTLARELGLDVWVFEEGYLRPDYITIERGGVMGNSSLPRDAATYLRAAAELPEAPAAKKVGNTFLHHVLWTILHSMAVTFLGWRYPRYRHHRDVNSFSQAWSWVRGGARKLYYRVREARVLRGLVGKRYFLVPLQVYCDASLQHSPYERMEDLMDEVTAAFASHAQKDELLVFKHHPHDLPYRDYTRHLRRLAAQHGLVGRIVYVHDLHLPTLLKHSRGVITMNSTVGLSALHHGTPVKVTGRAIYDIPGLTSQASLAEFFGTPGRVDRELYAAFCRYLRQTNQINGSFYKRLREMGSVSGLDPNALSSVDGESAGLLSTTAT